MSANRAIQRKLDDFSRRIISSDYTIRKVTKGAFTQARSKLNAWAFTRLNEVAVETFYNEAEYYVWHGMRLLGVDGTRLVLPNHPSVKEEFGECLYGPNADSPQSIANASMLYDVLNHLTIDARIAPYKKKSVSVLCWRSTGRNRSRGICCCSIVATPASYFSISLWAGA